MAVTVSNSLAELEKETLEEGRGERSRVGTFAVRIDEFLEIRIEKFENQVEIGLGFVAGVIGVNVLDRKEADDVERLREHLKKRNFTESGRRDAFLIHLEPGFFESNELTC